MNTVVFQSAKAEQPLIIQQSMQTIRDWAAMHRFDYRFYGDELFDLAPSKWDHRFSSKEGKMDYCRLIQTKELLKEYERVVWADSDIYVFVPEELKVSESTRPCFSQEVFGTPSCFMERANNAFYSFHYEDETFLDTYIRYCESRLNMDHPMSYTEIGPTYIGKVLRKKPCPIDVYRNITVLAPTHIHAIRDGSPEGCRQYLERQAPLAAVNLCGHHIKKVTRGLYTDAHLRETVKGFHILRLPPEECNKGFDDPSPSSSPTQPSASCIRIRR